MCFEMRIFSVSARAAQLPINIVNLFISYPNIIKVVNKWEELSVNLKSYRDPVSLTFSQNLFGCM